ncbi:MAG: hypothetical protein KGZ83_13090 [Sulfuricella sp.]|nr:hypothetical protein [Sulfuricella sp.]
MSTEQQAPMTFWGEFRSSLLIAAGLYYIDAIWLGQGGIAVLALLALVIFFIPATLLAWYRKNLFMRNLRAARTFLYLLMAAAILITVRIDLAGAREKGETIVAALHAYQAKTGQYPDELEQLVPAYLPAIPKARFSLSMNEYRYFVTKGKDSHTLSYIASPPFGFTYYTLEKGQWAVKD